MLVDTHSHTYLCKHAQLVKPRAYFEIAKQMGFTHFAFCDHNPFEGNDYDFRHRMDIKELDLFNKMYEDQKAVSASENLPTPLKLMEVDWQVFNGQNTLQFVDTYLNDFDGVIGSIHMNNEDEMKWLDAHSADEFLEMFKTQWLLMVKSKRFQISAHFDFFKEYCKPVKEIIQTEDGLKKIDDWIIQTIKEGVALNNDIIIEINTSPSKYDPMFETFVDRYVIRALSEAGVKMTIGSDSHWLKNVGQRFKDILEFLVSIGCKRLYYPEKKVIKSYDTEEALRLIKGNAGVDYDALDAQYKL